MERELTETQKLLADCLEILLRNNDEIIYEIKKYFSGIHI